MEAQFSSSSLNLLILGLLLAFLAFLVDSKQQNRPAFPPITQSRIPAPAPAPSPGPPPPPASRNRRPGFQGNARDRTRSDNGRKRPPRTSSREEMNLGKKIGLLFLGIAATLQVGIVGFLVFKRRQLMKVKDRYETCSTS